MLSAILLLFCCYSVQGQGENNAWIFGHDAGLNFNSGTPVAIQKHIGSDEGCASVSNENGSLLFYCIGTTVWNKNGQMMPNGSNIVPYAAIGSSQGAVIVPVTNSATQYYVFSLEEMEDIASNSAACRLSYSIVDMSLNGGLGDVVASKKGIQLGSGLGEQMIAVPGDNCNVWLLVHSRGINQFEAYQIDTGISTTPVISTAGNLQGQLAYLSGVMKVSPDRSKIVLCSAADQVAGISGTTGAELYNFDPATGIVSNALTLDNTDICYGAAFSPDNSKLYIDGDLYQVHGQFLSQYDLSQPTASGIVNSKTYLYNNPYSGFVKITDMRLGPDGKIYMNAAGSLEYMDVINNPNLAGLAGNYTPAAIALATNTTGDKGITNVYAAPMLEDTTISRTDTLCLSHQGDSLILHATSGYYFWEWNDSTTDSVKTIKQPGIYWVRSKTYCEAHIDSFYVKTGSLVFSIGNDTTICAVPYTLYGPSGAGISYLWQDGSTANSYNVVQSGIYSLTADDEGCKYNDSVSVTYIDIPPQSLPDTLVCEDSPFSINLTVAMPSGAGVAWSNGSTEASIQVSDTGTYIATITAGQCTQTDSARIGITYCDCIVAFPNAFTPNNDGKNDLFRIIDEPQCPISGYILQIYNRWGQEVFTTTDPGKGWDGTYGSKPADIGTYMYHVTFQAGDRGAFHKHSGDVTLIR